MHVHVSTIMKEKIILCTYWTSYLDVFPPHSPLSVAGNDYTSVSEDRTFSATTTSQTVMIMASNDSIVENEEMFTLSLTTDDPAVTVPTATVTVSITDNTSECMY